MRLQSWGVCMAKADKEPVDDEEPKDGEEGAAGGAASQGFVKRLLSNRKMLIIVGAGALVMILGLGAGSYFLFFSGSGDAAQTAAAEPYVPPTPPQVAFYQVPDLLVNIQTPDGTAAYL